ncbi:hypothetical protein P171DRAFT_434054 [Karstenula rhodostoma CBS 690.94]|uniref:Uncharacterized protein n=1 Tax=Karstenula rhodostoma CBS 690.94 TaxID=1392251 RepID=A0A9P4U9X0_9PLEO|nr:hypothetical protein P171DRAFT_434054 [Karstenula rhodostoma CBS 690.94]
MANKNVVFFLKYSCLLLTVFLASNVAGSYTGMSFEYLGNTAVPAHTHAVWMDVVSILAIQLACCLPVLLLVDYIYRRDMEHVDMLRLGFCSSICGMLWSAANPCIIHAAYPVTMSLAIRFFGYSGDHVDFGRIYLRSVGMFELCALTGMFLKLEVMVNEDKRERTRAYSRYNAINRGPEQPKVTRAQAEEHYLLALGRGGKVKEA